MRGTPVLATGIEYHERHTVEPDGRVPGRFGEPLEIPEDLIPIPRERPTALDINHPLAKYVTVWMHVTPDDPHLDQDAERFKLVNAVFADQATGTALSIKRPARGEENPFGVYTHEVLTGKGIDIEYDEAAIEKENKRRLTRALQIAALYAEVIDTHHEYVAESARLKAEQSEADRAVAESNTLAEANVTFGKPAPKPDPSWSRERTPENDNAFASNLMNGLDAMHQQQQAEEAALRKRVRELEAQYGEQPTTPPKPEAQDDDK